MTSPVPGSTLTSTSTTFTWNAGTGVSYYYLWIGTAPGGLDLMNTGTTATSLTLNLPGNGAPIYVRLWSKIGSTLQHNDYIYTEFKPAAATMTSPAH